MFGSKADQHGRFWSTAGPWIVVVVLMNVSILLTRLVGKQEGVGKEWWVRGWRSGEGSSSSRSVEGLAAGLPGFSSIRVVSLGSRRDRRAHMEGLAAFLRLPNLHFSDAVPYSDPRVHQIVQHVGNNTKADNHRAERGHVACRLSHQKALLAADAADDLVTLILEDDVDIEAAFSYLAGTILRDVPNDWDLIFFGHTDFSDEARHGRAGSTGNFYIYKSVEPQGGHGYAVSRKGRKLVLDLLENRRPGVYETDWGQPIDEIFMYLARLHRAQLYSIIPDLIVQLPLFPSDIQNTTAGFDDGLHAKTLLDSARNRIRSTPAPSISHNPSRPSLLP